MSTIRSFSVGNGDTFYIRHNSDNFTIIDCHLTDENRDRIVDEIRSASAGVGVTRFVSTHPDEDHLKGFKHLDEALGMTNFYCVENDATKEDESEDFQHYRKRHDGAFHIQKGCARRWMNRSDDERGAAGVHIHWPDRSNVHFQEALRVAEEGGSPNNISAVISYQLQEGVVVMWLGDLETDFMEAIADEVDWPKVNILFAAHHGRQSGRVPHALLDKLKPEIIVLGEAPSRHLHYYGGYDTILQNSAGDLTFECVADEAHIFAAEEGYYPDHLLWKPEHAWRHSDNYIGSLKV